MSLPNTDATGVVQTIANGTPTAFNAGRAYDVSGKLCITSTLSSDDVYHSGLRFSAAGLLVVASTEPSGQPFNYVAGWPVHKVTGATIVQQVAPTMSDPRIAGVAVDAINGVFVSDAGAAAGFNPSHLYQAGELGVWIDASDRSTLFQDSAGTVPVTQNGDPVGFIIDKSGSGTQITQVIAARRLVYRTDGTYHWLESDGVDDFLRLDLVTTTNNEFWGFQSLSVMGVASTNALFGSQGNVTTWETGGTTAPYGGFVSPADALLNGVTLTPNTAGALALANNNPVVFALVGMTGNATAQSTDYRLAGGYGFGFDPAMRIYQYISVNTITPAHLVDVQNWIAEKLPAV